MVRYLISFGFLSFLGLGNALLCYDGKSIAESYLNNCTQCKFCGIGGSGVGFTSEPSFMAIQPDELDEIQEKYAGKILSTQDAAGQQDETHKVLNLCWLESYDLHQWLSQGDFPEIIFRCVCSYDRCNKGSSIPDFLSRAARKEVLRVQKKISYAANADQDIKTVTN